MARPGIIGLLLAAVLSQAAGNVLLSSGMKAVAGGQGIEASDWSAVLIEGATTPLVLAGMALTVLFFVLFSVALSKADLSFVAPAISAEVVLNVALAEYVLHESVSPARWAGALLISLGVVLVLRSEPRTFAAEEAGPLLEEVRQ